MWGVLLTKGKLGRNGLGKMSGFDGIPYYNPIEYNDMMYSVDNIKPKFTLGHELTQMLFSNFESLHCFYSTFWLKSDKEVAYRKLEFEITFSSKSDKRLTAHVGIYRDKKEIDTANGFIQFNPNKVFQSEIAQQQIKRFLNMCSTCAIVKCDVAIDIPCSITEFVPLKGRIIMQTVMKSLESITTYWGKRGEKGSAKLYNKTCKSNLPNDVTRLEITLGNPEDSDWEKNLKNAIPPVYICSDVSDISENTNIKLTSPEQVILALSSEWMKNYNNRIKYFRILEMYVDKKRRKIIKDKVLSSQGTPLQVNHQTITQVVKDISDELCGNNISV